MNKSWDKAYAGAMDPDPDYHHAAHYDYLNPMYQNKFGLRKLRNHHQRRPNATADALRRWTARESGHGGPGRPEEY